MRFVDANVFVHAYLKTKRILTTQEIQLKEDAKKIVNRLNQGEQAITSVVHLAEIANLLEDYLPLDEAIEVERALCFRDTLEIEVVDRTDCSQALAQAEEYRLGFADAIALVVMRRKGLHEIYSFDRDFDNMIEIKRIVK